jgi:hypothetical protein
MAQGRRLERGKQVCAQRVVCLQQTWRDGCNQEPGDNGKG